MKKYNLKNSISSRLFKGVFVIIIVNILIVTASLVINYILKNRSDKIVIEYHELDAVHELKHSLNLFKISILESESPTKSEMVTYLNKINNNITACNLIITNNHNKNILSDFIIDINKLSENISNNIIDTLNNEKYLYYKDLYNSIIHNAEVHLDTIIEETKEEINQHVDFFSKSYIRSNITVILLATLLIFASYMWGLGFIRKIFTEIKILLIGTEKYIEGEHTIRIETKYDDELNVLAKSFNKMIETINTTTISRDYFDNIFQSIFDFIIVTDKNFNILSINAAVKNNLSYNLEELSEKNINLLFEKELNITIKAQNIVYNSEQTLISKNKNKIPVIISISAIKTNDTTTGYVVIAHDISEKLDNENKLNNIRRENLIALNEAQEEERLRIAKEIHDGLGQILTAIHYTIENKFKEKYQNDIEYKENIYNLQTQIDNAIVESKNIAHDLIPILLKDFGLSVAVKNLIEYNYKNCGIKINFATFYYEKRVDEKIEKALYRIIQEALSNIIKHSKAQNANIQIIKLDDLISLTIDDDGIGFNPETISNETKYRGIGLFSMKERVYAFNGVFQLNSDKNKGTEILIDIPIK